MIYKIFAWGIFIGVFLSLGLSFITMNPFYLFFSMGFIIMGDIFNEEFEKGFKREEANEHEM